ncbi:MAG TPA: SGNH/GDSL hydrolase family protein, partial [Burkholderiales bacterium]|nr:SGNH/GDSL hydrolase family protein [Burkholderiales bacterium]
AVGGARARPAGPFDLSTQVGLFLRDFGGQAPADALYIVFVGGNDLRDVLTAPAQGPSIIGGALSAIQNNLLTLHAAGAHNFLVANAPNLGLVPAVRLLGAQDAATFLASQFNAGLKSILEGLEFALGLNIVPLDVFTILSQVVATPSAFGLTDVTQPCIAVDTKAQPFCANPGRFLFWDGIHPTVAGHRILAESARAALNATQ